MPRSVPNSLVTIVVCFFAILATAQSQENAAKIKHYGYSSKDRLLECIQQVYSKHAIRMGGVWAAAEISCPRNKEALLKILEGSGVRLFEDVEWVYIVPSFYFTNNPADGSYRTRMTWRHIRIVAKAGPGPWEHHVSPDEVKTVEREVLRSARMIPLNAPLWYETKKSDEAVLNLNLKIYKTKLVPDGPDAFVTVIDQMPLYSDSGRLVFGELQEGQYQVKWDSPLLNANGIVQFKDVNGDGNNEIVFMSQTCGNACYPPRWSPQNRPCVVTSKPAM